MPIRKVGTPEFGGQALANAGALERQALATEAQFMNFMNQLPLETANKFIGLLEAARARRAQKSAASEARKQQRATQIGVTAAATIASAGLGAALAPAAGAAAGAAGGAAGAAGAAGPAAGTIVANAPLALGAAGAAAAPAALTAGQAALVGGTAGLLGSLAPAALGGLGVPQFVAPQTFGPFAPQPRATPTTLTGSLGNFTLPTGQTGGATPVAPVGQAGRISGDIQSGVSPFDLGTLSNPTFGPLQVRKSATERAITGEEPTAGITITPKDIEQSAQNLKKIGQQAIDEGDAETALQLAKILADLEFRGAA